MTPNFLLAEWQRWGAGSVGNDHHGDDEHGYGGEEDSTLRWCEPSTSLKSVRQKRLILIAAVNRDDDELAS